MGALEIQSDGGNVTAGRGAFFTSTVNEHDEKKLQATTRKPSMPLRARGKKPNSHSDEIHTADCNSIPLQWPFPQWRNELFKKLHSRNAKVNQYQQILLENPMEESDRSKMSVTGFEHLSKQFTSYKKKNAKKLKWLTIVFCLSLVALFICTAILICWISNQGGTKNCNSVIVSDAATYAEFLKNNCTEIKVLEILSMTGVIKAPSLVTVDSIIISGCSSNDTIIMFPNLTNITGSFRIEHNEQLRQVSMPLLVTVNDDVIMRNNSKLTQVGLQSLASARNVLLENSNMTDISFASLHTITSNLKLYRVALVSFIAPKLKYVGDEVVMEYVFPPIEYSLGRTLHPWPRSSRLAVLLHIAMPQLQQAGSLALRHVHGLENITFPALQDVGELDINGISYRYQQSEDTADELLYDQNIRDSLTFPALHIAERLQIKYCSGLYSVKLPSLQSVGEVNIEANPDLVTFEIDFVPKNTRAPQVSNVVFLLNSRLVRIALVNLQTSQQSISLYGNTALQDLQLESLSYIQTFAMLASTSLTHLRLPSLREGSLLVAENKALVTLEAPILQKGTTLFIFDNKALAKVLLPELAAIKVSKDYVDVPWLFSSVVGFMAEQVINGLVLFQGNRVLPGVHFPKLTTCRNALFLYQAQDFFIDAPALNNVTRLVLVGHLNITTANPNPTIDMVLSLPSLAATNMLIIFRTLIDYMLFPRLEVAETFALAYNPLLKDLFAPVLSWPITDPALVCLENNPQYCAAPTIATLFAPSSDVTTYRNCYVKNGQGLANQTCPSTNAVRADCCDQAVIELSTGERQCTANNAGKCRDLLDHVNKTASHVLTLSRYNTTL